MKFLDVLEANKRYDHPPEEHIAKEHRLLQCCKLIEAKSRQRLSISLITIDHMLSNHLPSLSNWFMLRTSEHTFEVSHYTIDKMIEEYYP